MTAQLPPSPSVSRVMQGLRFALKPFEFLEAAREECGDIFTLRMPGDLPRVVTCDPEHIKAIFSLPPDAYQMADQALPLNLGRGSLLFLDGERHREMHALMMPPLHGAHLRSYEESIEAITHEAIDRWPVGEPFTLLEQMQQITLTSFLRCVYGLEPGPDLERVRELVLTWLKGAMSPLTFTLSLMVGAGRMRSFLDRYVEDSVVTWPNPSRKHRRLPWQRLGDAKAELMARIAHDVSACRRAGRGARMDVLAILAEARDARGALMPVADAVDELVTVLVGGYETITASLCWALHHLMRHPEALARVVEERAALAGSPSHKRPWLDACVKESQRLSPIVPVVNRRTVTPVQLGEHTLPADVILWPCIYLAQRHPASWEAPERFAPERFLNGRRPRSHEWLPFGGGLRRCIGAAFAEFEMRVVLSTILSRVTLAAPPHPDRHPLLRGITVSPRDHMRVIATRIQARRD